MSNNSNNFLLDSSALLALIFEEEGADKVSHILKSTTENNVFMTSVNISEAISKMLREGYNKEEVMLIYNMRISVIDVDQEIATQAAFYDEITKKFGLSLGDRVCLSAAWKTGYKLLTADKIWKKLNLKGVDLLLIR